MQTHAAWRTRSGATAYTTVAQHRKVFVPIQLGWPARTRHAATRTKIFAARSKSISQSMDSGLARLHWLLALAKAWNLSQLREVISSATRLPAANLRRCAQGLISTNPVRPKNGILPLAFAMVFSIWWSTGYSWPKARCI